jgi:acyl-CoA thioester hydrolase
MAMISAFVGAPLYSRHPQKQLQTCCDWITRQRAFSPAPARCSAAQRPVQPPVQPSVVLPSARDMAVLAHSTELSGSTYVLRKVVLPADSDYSGSMWHGSYVSWLEEARVRHLAECGIDYASLVLDSRMELVLASLALRYVRPARLGEALVLTQKLSVTKSSRVRLVTETEFRRAVDDVLVASAEVTCTPFNVDTQRVMRKWPADFEEAVVRLFGGDLPEFLKQNKSSDS